MKQYKIIISLTSLFFILLLVSCNNNAQVRDHDTNNVNDNISSLNTDSSSENYPHTVPVKVQEAKYEFKTIAGNNGNVVSDQLRQQLQRQQGNTQTQQDQQQQTQDHAQRKSQQQDQSNTQNQKQPQDQDQGEPQQQTDQQAPQNESTQNNKGGEEFVTAVIELTNAERQKEGLSALEAYPELSNVAKMKAQDMQDKGYFSHTSPTYGSPFDMIRDFDISYQSAAENIAHGQRTPEEVVNAWMESEGHRANILDEKMTHIGVGVEKTGYHWAQMFIKK